MLLQTGGALWLFLRSLGLEVGGLRCERCEGTDEGCDVSHELCGEGSASRLTGCCLVGQCDGELAQRMHVSVAAPALRRMDCSTG